MNNRGFIYLSGFIGSIWFANWLLQNVGVQFDPNGPHMIPVWPGIMAPSGVLAIGLGFTMRDLVHSELGAKWAIVGVIVGAIVSAALSPALALASGVAFLFSELMDLFVYVPLRRRNIVAAVVASNVVGLIADSVLFLWLAFGSLAYIEGQIIGKLWMTMLVMAIMMVRSNLFSQHRCHCHATPWPCPGRHPDFRRRCLRRRCAAAVAAVLHDCSRRRDVRV